ncbi:MAG: hypothetical protein IT562_07090 [Alphaproteobacteria bacterium]|nr:hypothetical protein [Alphaproteobacteria bacterium]
MVDEFASSRTGLFAAAHYTEPPRDLRRAFASQLAGLVVYATIVLAMAAFG